MGLLRTILTLIILVIVVHVGLVIFGLGPETHEVVAAIYGLGTLLEAPAQALMPEQNFFVVALVSIVSYLVLQVLLGLLER